MAGKRRIMNDYKKSPMGSDLREFSEYTHEERYAAARRAKNKLSQDDKEEIEEMQGLLTRKIKNFGEVSANELLASLGLWFKENGYGVQR